MTSRSTAFAAVRGHIARAITSDGAATLVTQSALRDAEELLSVSAPAEDLDVGYALGLLFWYRYQSPDGGDPEDLATAVRFLAPVFVANHAPVPIALRYLFLGRTGQAPQFNTVTAINYALYLRASSADGDDQPSRDAAAIFRVALAATPPDHPDRLQYASHLGETLLSLGDHAEYLPALVEAAETG